MEVTVTASSTTPASPEAVRALLHDADLLQALVPGLERIGELWRYDGELTTISFSPGRMVWVATPIAVPNARLRADLRLRATPIGTAVELTLLAEAPDGPLAWLLRRDLRFRLDRSAQAAIAALAGMAERADAGLAAGEMPSHPRTRAAFAAMGAGEHLERVARMDETWAAIRAAAANAPPPERADEPYYRELPALPPDPSVARFDLIYAGGSLGLLHAAVMAARFSKRVLLFDRSAVGTAHREWNISRDELAELVGSGVFSWDELRQTIMAEYETGVVRFYNGRERPAELWLPHVLDVAIDAGALLRLARQKLERAGGTILDGRLFRGLTVSTGGPLAVRVELDGGHGPERYDAALLLDGMGSVSPLSMRRFASLPFAGVCPTVGTVVSGLEEGDAPNQHNPTIGDILLTIEHGQRGQQYMWEGFPGRDGELTVYLFYYDTLRPAYGETALRQGPPPNLMDLFEDYFALLPSYKTPGSEFRHLKPVYGYIPARHSVRGQEAPLLRGVLPIGDSAAQQSPLTFCGFGSHVRNLCRTATLLDIALASGNTGPEQLAAVSPYQVNVSLNWVFSRFMQPWDAGEDVNALQNVFLDVLNELGTKLSVRFFRDKMRWGDYHRLVLGMLRHHPQIMRKAWRVLGPGGWRQWAGDYLVYSASALGARAARRAGPRRRERAARWLGRARPKLGFRLRAQYAEWATMGWID